MNQKMFAKKDDKKMFGADGNIIDSVTGLVDAVGKGVSSSISAANNKSYTETKNENKNYSFTDSKSLAIIGAVAAVAVVAVVLIIKKMH